MALDIPIELDIEIPSGDDRTFSASISNSDGVTDVDMTSYDVFFTLKRTKSEYDSDANMIYQLTTSDISLSTSGSPLQTDISFNYFARESSLYTSTPLPIGTYYYDLQFVSPSGTVQTWWRGKFKVTWHSTVEVTP